MDEGDKNTHVARIHYVETVRGKPRAFVYQVSVQAPTTDWARQLAVAEFNWLAERSSSGWIREIERVEVRPVAGAATKPPLKEKPADY